jgi:hypothetical protein
VLFPGDLFCQIAEEFVADLYVPTRPKNMQREQVKTSSAVAAAIRANMVLKQPRNQLFLVQVGTVETTDCETTKNIFENRLVARGKKTPEDKMLAWVERCGLLRVSRFCLSARWIRYFGQIRDHSKRRSCVQEGISKTRSKKEKQQVALGIWF